MNDMSDESDFYEPDEPVDEVLAAFNRAEKARTRRPARGYTEYLVIRGLSQVRKAVVESRNTVNLVTS